MGAGIAGDAVDENSTKTDSTEQHWNIQTFDGLEKALEARSRADNRQAFE